MKTHCIFITTLACVLSVAFGSHIHSLDAADALRRNLMKRDIPTDHPIHKCYEEFTLQTDTILSEVKKNGLDCAQAAEKEKTDFDLRNGDERKKLESFIAQKMKIVQDAMDVCSKLTSASEYFSCVLSFEKENKGLLDNIGFKSRQYSYEMEAIEHHKRTCLEKSIDESKSKTALSNLRKCIIQSFHPIQKPTASTTPSPAPPAMNAMSENLTRLRNIYSALQNCNRGGEEIAECLEEAAANKELTDYLRSRPADFFPQLNEIDVKENICLRHLAFQLISSSDYVPQLSRCLIVGRGDAAEYEEVDDILVKELDQLYKSISSCKYEYDDKSDTIDCVHQSIEKTQKEIDGRSIAIQEENAQKIIFLSGIDDSDVNCMRYTLKRLQFMGVFMSDEEMAEFEKCFY